MTSPLHKPLIRTALATALLALSGAAQAATTLGAAIVVDSARPVEHALARAGDGRFVAVWTNPVLHAVMARRYAADGTPAGNATTIASVTTGGIGNPHVAINASGDYVVSWEQYGEEVRHDLFPRPFSDPFITFGVVLSGSVHVHSFSADGSPRGDDLTLVNHAPRSDFATGFSSNVAIDSDGDLSLTWIDGHSTPQISTYGPQTYSIEQNLVARRFHADGRPIGLKTLLGVASFTLLDSRLPGIGLIIQQPAIASDSAGNSVIVWTAANFAVPALSGVFAHRLGANGLLSSGPPLPVALGLTQASGTAISMTANGRYTIAWDGCRTGVCARNYLPLGLPVGREYSPSEDLPVGQFGGAAIPSVALDAGGRAAFGYTLYDQGIIIPYVRAFDSRGVASGGSQRIAPARVSDFSIPVASDDAGNFIAGYLGTFENPVGVFQNGFQVQRYVRP